jgi:hypothetical protein
VKSFITTFLYMHNMYLIIFTPLWPFLILPLSLPTFLIVPLLLSCPPAAQIPRVRENMFHLCLWDWLISQNMMISSSTHLPANHNFIFLYGWVEQCVCVSHFLYQFIWFRNLAIVTNAAINKHGMQVTLIGWPWFLQVEVVYLNHTEIQF